MSSLTEDRRAGPNGGYFGAFVKFGQPPGWRYGEWDFRPEWNYFGERQEDVEVRFDASKEAWQTGALVPVALHCRSFTHGCQQVCAGCCCSSSVPGVVLM